MTGYRSPPASPTARDLIKDRDVALPEGMSARAAADLLEGAGAGVAAVVDSEGRCVGLFNAREYRRASDHGGPNGGAGPVRPAAPLTGRPDPVRNRMDRRFEVATPEAGVHELLHRLNGTADAHLVVLDRQRRPMGVVYGMDVLAAWVNEVRAESGCAPAG